MTEITPELLRSEAAAQEGKPQNASGRMFPDQVAAAHRDLADRLERDALPNPTAEEFEKAAKYYTVPSCETCDTKMELVDEGGSYWAWHCRDIKHYGDDGDYPNEGEDDKIAAHYTKAAAQARMLERYETAVKIIAGLPVKLAGSDGYHTYGSSLSNIGQVHEYARQVLNDGSLTP